MPGPSPHALIWSEVQQHYMAQLVGRARRFCLCRQIRTDLGPQRSSLTRSRLLVCLSHKGATHSQTLSRTHGQGDI
jgi:hypothetical protein